MAETNDRLYYLYGDIDGVKEATSKLLKKLLKSSADEYVKLDGRKMDLGEMAVITQMYPMMAERNCILINDLNAEEISADGISELQKILADLPPLTAVIFNITGITITDERQRLTAKNKKLIEYIRKSGVVYEIKTKTQSELIKAAMRRVNKNGSSINFQNAAEIVSLCMNDNMIINSEIDKLCAYADGKEITSEMIRRMVPRQIETNVFILAKAVLALKTGEAIRTLDELMRQNSDPIAVLAVISLTFIDLYRAKTALLSNRNVNDIISDFNYRGREFVVRNAFNASMKIPAEALRECIEILKETDLSLKSVKVPGRALIEEAVIKMMSACRR